MRRSYSIIEVSLLPELITHFQHSITANTLRANYFIAVQTGILDGITGKTESLCTYEYPDSYLNKMQRAVENLRINVLDNQRATKKIILYIILNKDFVQVQYVTLNYELTTMNHRLITMNCKLTMTYY